MVVAVDDSNVEVHDLVLPSPVGRRRRGISHRHRDVRWASRDVDAV